MNYKSFVEEQFATDEIRSELSTSDEAYLQFRTVVDPGMLRAGFDLTPGKSATIISRRTGDPFVDQSLRSHILSGAAFGARFNNALGRLGLGAAKDRDELLRALALFSCHDLHKTDEAQRRRFRRKRGLTDEDKDVTDEEVSRYVNALDLDELGTGLAQGDYLASALATEKRSGRHKAAGSPAFRRLRNWVRLMDAAAGLEDPADVADLSTRASEITERLQLDYHRLDDVKGVTTNLLNSTVASHLATEPGVEPIVYFDNGVVYAVDRDAHSESIINSNDVTDAHLDDLTNSFINLVKTSNPESTHPESVTGLLTKDGVIGKGYVKADGIAYFLFGRETVFDAVRLYLTDRANQDGWNVYGVYKQGVAAGLAAGFADSAPPSHLKVQAVGAYIGTVYSEIYNVLNDNDPRQSIHDLAAALGCPEVGEFLVDEHRADSFPVDIERVNEDGLAQVAEVSDEPVDDVPEFIRSIDLHDGGMKSFAQTLALAFVSEEGHHRPVEWLLQRASERLDTYYREWQPHWDEDRQDSEWDPDWHREIKIRQFEKEIQGVLIPATKHYIRSNLDIGGQWFPRQQEKSKLDEYTRSSQARVCMLCNDILVGSGSMNDFPGRKDTIGRALSFTHERAIDPSGSEPKGLACPVCTLEMVLRNVISSVNAGRESHYLFLAPDHFLSPIDLRITKRLYQRFQPESGDLLPIVRAVVGTNPTDRSKAADQVIRVLELAEEREEYRRLALNYDGAFQDDGALGVFRFDAPRRQKGNQRYISPNAHWCLSTYFAVVFAWLSGSRVLLTDTPIPAVEPSEFNEMVRIEQAPGPVQRFVGETVSISRLPTTTDDEPWGEFQFSHLIKEDDDTNERTETDQTTTSYEHTINTGLGATLYKLSAFVYITRRVHGVELQRFATVLSTVDEPSPGASAFLKGNEKFKYYTREEKRLALRAAAILDTLMHENKTNRLERLANAGFEAARPEANKSNYEYERLFRVSRDALSDGLSEHATRDELVDIVTGDVMKAAARARTDNPDERWLREPAESFAQVFVDEVFSGICDGDFYELRRLENHLAAGYNAAMRRKQQAWFEERKNATDSSNDAGDRVDESDAEERTE